MVPKVFGVELRRRRLAAGVTLSELAAMVHYSKSHLSKVENGVKPAVVQLARSCDAALGANGALTDLVPRERPTATRDMADPHTDEVEVWSMTMYGNGASRFQAMDRRDALAIGAASIAGAAIGAWQPRSAHGGCPDEVIAGFRTILGQFRTMGQSVAPAIVLPSIIANTHALRGIALQTVGKQRAQAMLLAARFAEYAGWMAQESGDTQGALSWTSRAVGFAEASGDREMGAYALVRRALVAMYAKDGPLTVELARRARTAPGASDRVRGLAAQREAQGEALLGDLDMCRRALDEARELLARAGSSTGDAMVLGTSTVSDPAAVVTGWCLYDLGRPSAAAQILDREVERIPPNAVRARARFGARQALAHAAAGEIEYACALTERLLDSAEAVDSATIRMDLRAIARTLARWHRNSAVRDLNPRLLRATIGVEREA